MALAAESGHAPLIERMAELIRASGRDAAAVTQFTEILFSEPAQTELDGYTPEGLAALAISAWDFAAQRADGRHKIRAFNPDQLGAPHGAVTVVEILNDDMPFLVDSIMGEILERGLAVHLVFHPILLVVRDDEHQIQAVLDPGDDVPEGVSKESYIHVHIERLDSEEALNELKQTLSEILEDVRTVVQDWKPMRDRLKRSVGAYTDAPPPVPVSDLAESLQFLKWLSDNNFTFLGMRAMAFVGGAEEGQLEPVPDSGLGILRDPDLRVLRRGTELVHMTPEIRKFFLAPAPLIIAKANVRARVHRRSYMDYIGIKIYGDNGEISGELRIVGLFTSVAYTHSPKNIPFLRHKVDLVVRRSGYEPSGHSGKALINVIDTYPRDELFQVDVNLLYEFATDIMSLELKPRVRVYARIDEFDRYVSLLVYVPRDRYSTNIRQKIGEFLADTYNGRVSAYYPFFPEGPLVRIHFIIGRFEGKTPERDRALVEKEILDICRTWEDRLKDVISDRLVGAAGTQAAGNYLSAFSPGYQVAYSPDRALQDIAQLECLGAETPVAVDFYADDGDEPGRVRVALYHLHGPIRLSRRVPILENLGFAVIDERSYRLRPKIEGEATEVSLHDMVLETRDGEKIDLDAHQARLEDCFLAVWNGGAANAHYNRLVLQAGLDWREAAAVRAYGAYLRQIRAPFGQAYLSDTLMRHTQVTKDLIELFRRRFDPTQSGGKA
ncbi:MAG: NAD-glutamate dehydrogenase, partial [Methyloligellaceae bacterium]